MPAYPKKVECLAEAIANLSGYRMPDGPLYQARNPGAIKAQLPDHAHDEAGNRVFQSFLDGYQSLLHDLSVKISGRSRIRLAPDNTLSDLALCFHINNARPLALFLKAALRDDTVSPKTELSYFQTEK